jgi:hypothetical protein
MPLPPISLGTLVTVRLDTGGLAVAETTSHPRNGSIRVFWLYSKRDLQAAGYPVPRGYSADTYWRTRHQDTVPAGAIVNINPPVKIAATPSGVA